MEEAVGREHGDRVSSTITNSFSRFLQQKRVGRRNNHNAKNFKQLFTSSQEYRTQKKLLDPITSPEGSYSVTEHWLQNTEALTDLSQNLSFQG